MRVKKVILFFIILAVIVIAVFVYISYTLRPYRLRISTTTSLYATGLLDYLADAFVEKVRKNIIIDFTAVGSGQALKLASQGDVDAVFSHAPNLEIEYIQQGVIVNRTFIAYNYFVIVGPADDPANIKNCTPEETFKRIYDAGERGEATFVSRGDNSGTHQREFLLWKLANLTVPSGKSWYIETGQDMTNTLLISNEKKAYTLSDIGTFLKLKIDGSIPNLEILVAQGDVLINIYCAYIVNATMFPHVKADLAWEFISFVASDEGQDLIASYGVDKYGQPLFYPAHGREKYLEQMWNWLISLYE